MTTTKNPQPKKVMTNKDRMSFEKRLERSSASNTDKKTLSDMVVDRKNRMRLKREIMSQENNKQAQETFDKIMNPIWRNK